ncbi:MAG: hypothetical protein SGPRY_008624 [Prymnesium sp.]
MSLVKRARKSSRLFSPRGSATSSRSHGGVPPLPQAQAGAITRRSLSMEFGGVPQELKDDLWMERAQRTYGATEQLLAQQRSSYDQTQMKTFVRWWQAHVGDQFAIKDLAADLADGRAPLVLLEKLTGDRIKYNAAPKNLYERIENQGLFFARLHEMGVKIVSIGPEDIADGGKTTSVLGLTWGLITHFHGELEHGIDLTEWLRQVAGYSEGKKLIEWLSDGRVLCGLLRAYDPSSTEAGLSQSGGEAAVEAAFAAAEVIEASGWIGVLGASRLLDTHDLVEKKIDERSLTTYLMTLQTALIRHNAARLAFVRQEYQDILTEASNETAWAFHLQDSWKEQAGRLWRLGRKEALPEAESLLDSLESEQKTEKRQHQAVHSELHARREDLSKTMEVVVEGGSLFLRDQRVNDPSSGEPLTSQAEQRLTHAMLELDGAWQVLTEAEEALRVVLDGVLIERRTDAMLADLVARARAIAKQANERTAHLTATQMEGMADTQEGPV